MDGFSFELDSKCSYCPNFEPKLVQYDCRKVADIFPKIINIISCKFKDRCPNGDVHGINIVTLPDNSCWYVCPWCGKKAVKILPETHISKLPYKCRNSKCGKGFIINV